jgi:alkanesulfonate monooxygenase SsuD/methylene tetrahydromethanopterin reductase-like flavin-dependent oxidoreductase (luciferase family)
MGGDQGIASLGTAFFGPDKLGTQANIRLYRKALAAAGYDPAAREVVAVSQMYCAPTKAEALRLGGQYAINYYRFFASLDRLGSRSILPQHFSRVTAQELDAANLVLLGDPDDLVARIEEIRNFYGIDFLLMEIAQGGAPNSEVVRAMELFAHHVIPKFRGVGES